MLEERWAMMRWMTVFIEETQENVTEMEERKRRKINPGGLGCDGEE
jgi:hypothetical protein